MKTDPKDIINWNCFTGGYGFVFSAQDVATGKDYALKVIYDTIQSMI